MSDTSQREKTLASIALLLRDDFDDEASSAAELVFDLIKDTQSVYGIQAALLKEDIEFSDEINGKLWSLLCSYNDTKSISHHFATNTPKTSLNNDNDSNKNNSRELIFEKKEYHGNKDDEKQYKTLVIDNTSKQRNLSGKTVVEYVLGENIQNMINPTEITNKSLEIEQEIQTAEYLSSLPLQSSTQNNNKQQYQQQRQRGRNRDVTPPPPPQTLRTSQLQQQHQQTDDPYGAIPQSSISSGSTTTNVNNNTDKHQGVNEVLPLQYKVYRGIIKSITPKMATVELYNFPQIVTGYLSDIAVQHNQNIDLTTKYKENMDIYIKVLTLINNTTSMIDNKYQITVSCVDIDQHTGQDLNPQAPQQTLGLSNQQQQSYSGLSRQALQEINRAGGTKVRSSSQERWAEQQRQAGLDQINNIHGGYGVGIKHDDLSDDDDNVDVDINTSEASFLSNLINTNINNSNAGHNTTGNSSSLSSVSGTSGIALTRIPDGSLAKTAMAQSTLVRERAELRQAALMPDSENDPGIQQDYSQLSKRWVDPLANSKHNNDMVTAGGSSNNKQFASEIRSQNEAILAKRAEIAQLQQQQQKVQQYGRITDKTIKEQREDLPFFKIRQNFIDLFQSSQFMVVVGETGSGKTTQMAQYIYEENMHNNKMICITQPRRVAATSVATRVAEEMGCDLGDIVGYSVRFDDRTSQQTKLRFMTDGMLMREILLDPELSRYSVVIIDEAHERSVNTDILLALCKAAAYKRSDLKFIVTSATLDAQRFIQYLGPTCQHFTIPGRTHPVEIMYTNEPEPDYLEAAIHAVMSIHLREPSGDILVFLTGKEEIDSAVDMINHRMKELGASAPPLDPYPVYSSLPSEVQSQIFEPTPMGRRKVVFSTNIAEASITIDGIVYVIDSGFYKVKVFDPKMGMESLQIAPISQAQAKQRAGRAGRTRPGKCYRLYTESAFYNEMTSTTVPELQRCDLSSVVLLLKAIGVNDLLHFDFIDPPSPSAMYQALQHLYHLGAVDNDGLLTHIGARLSLMPIAPNLGKMLLVAADMNCVLEIATVVSLISGEDIWVRPRTQQDQADHARGQLSLRHGDHCTLVRVYNEWDRAHRSPQWSSKHYVSQRTLLTAANVRTQLLRTLANMKISMSSCGDNWNIIARAVTSGLFMNAAKKDQISVAGGMNSGGMTSTSSIPCYKTLTHGNIAYLHPASSLYQQMPQYIVYQRILLTTKEYLHVCTTIHPKWLIQLAPHLFTNKDNNNDSNGGPRIKERLQPLTDRYNAPNSWRLSRRKG